MNNYTGLEPSIRVSVESNLVLLAGRSILQPILLRDSVGYLEKVGITEEIYPRRYNWQ